MCKVTHVLLFISVIAILITGCSGAEENPVEPTTAPQDTSSDVNIARESNGDRALWGFWSLSFEPGTMEITITPFRNLQAHFNITNMILPPACDDCFEIGVNSFDQATRILDVDITLRNPTPVAGKDVRGILHTNDYGHLITNADDWTDYWDVPGGDTINPFVAFAKDEGNRVFAGMTEHTENYQVYIPKPAAYHAITFAVDASWPGNCKEPYSITDFTQDVITNKIGDEGLVKVTVLDWQDDVIQVRLYAEAITGVEYLNLIPVGGGVWQVSVTNNNCTEPGDQKVTFKARSAGSQDPVLYDVIPLTISEAPNSGWAQTWGGNGSESCPGVAVSNSGSIYVTGGFTLTADFDPGPGVDEYTSNGNVDVYLCRYGSAGGFVWARTWGGTAGDEGKAVALDSSGNAYLVGDFEDVVDFDPGPGTEEHSSAGLDDAYISKFDPDGELLWVRTWGGEGDDECQAIAIDDTGNIFVTGSFEGTTDFDPGAVGVDEHTSEGGRDVFLSFYDADGAFSGVRTWGGAGSDYGYGVAIDESFGVYVSGYFMETVDFDPGSMVSNKTSNGEEDSFLCWFDPSGDFLSVRTWGGAYDDRSYGITLDGSGYLYVCGYFSGGIIDFDPGPGVDEKGTHGWLGHPDAYISKYDLIGVYQWTRTWGGSNSEIAYGVGANASGYVDVTGEFNSYDADFKPGPGEDIHDTNGGYDIFISRYNDEGTYIWTVTLGESQDDSGSAVASVNTNNVLVAGYFRGSPDFNPSGGDIHTAGGRDAFLTKLLVSGNW